MTSLRESILSSTNSGKTEQVIKELSELLKIRFEKDFWYDEKNDRFTVWSLPDNTTIDVNEWPQHLKFASLEVSNGKDFKIIVDGQSAYEKFRECFECTIGDTINRYFGKTGETQVIFQNCKVKTSDLYYHINGRVNFYKCELNIMEGIKCPRIFIRKCNVQMPYGFDKVKILEVL